MSREATLNIPASIRQRLLNESRSDGRPFNEILQYFGMERFLFRLSQSIYVDRFILKGAMMFSVWQVVEARSTKDIDFLGKIDNAEEAIKEAISSILAIPAPEDGILFDAASIATSRITEDADYKGIRVTFRAQLDSARINMKLDIGFDDVVFPLPERLAFPTILPLPAPELLCYSRESAIAEKCQAMVKLGSLNSRMKDFFDIWLLSRQFNFEAVTLRESLHLTFEKRSTSLSGLSVFPKDFAEATQVQWKAFRSRLRLDHAPELFSEVLDHLAVFLGPFVLPDHGANPVDLKWIAPGPWINSKGAA